MTVIRLGLAVAIVSQAAASAHARDGREERMLQKLDPEARFEQICDLEAMKRISREAVPYRPERTIVSALSTPTIVDTTMSGEGGAFRSKGKWYQFSFTCQTTPDHMKVQAFSYKIGAPIPAEQWEAHGLW